MRSMSHPFALALAVLAVSPLRAAASDAVAVTPNPARPGQTVHFRWFFTGEKVVVSGGRFGKGTVVTGRTSLTDTPRQTTHYTFDVWFKGQATDPKTGQKSVKLLHSTYGVDVEVGTAASSLKSYRDPHGWQVSYLPDWKFDTVHYDDPANNALVFFQKEDDSVERLAVSILPSKEMTCGDLCQKVQADCIDHYDQIKVISQTDITFSGVPANLVVFSGIDHTHPGTRTQSIVLTFVRDGRAYVVSARTAAAQFAARQPLLEKMVRSFALNATSAAAH